MSDMYNYRGKVVRLIRKKGSVCYIEYEPNGKVYNASWYELKPLSDDEISQNSTFCDAE